MKGPRQWMLGLYRAYWRIWRPLTVGVRLIMEQEGRVLLVRHSYEAGLWYLPGGGVQRDETLEEAIRREAAEEVGAALGPLRLLGVYTNLFEGKSDHVAVMVCGEWTLDGATDGEIETWALFAPDRLPEGTSPGTRRRLAEYGAGPGPYLGRW